MIEIPEGSDVRETECTIQFLDADEGLIAEMRDFEFPVPSTGDSISFSRQSLRAGPADVDFLENEGTWSEKHGDEGQVENVEHNITHIELTTKYGKSVHQRIAETVVHTDFE